MNSIHGHIIEGQQFALPAATPKPESVCGADDASCSGSYGDDCGTMDEATSNFQDFVAAEVNGDNDMPLQLVQRTQRSVLTDGTVANLAGGALKGVVSKRWNGQRWNDHETRTRIELFGKFPTLIGRRLWEKVGESIRQRGFNRTDSQCREKWRDVYTYYKKHLDQLQRTSDFPNVPFFKELHAIYSKRLPNTNGAPSGAWNNTQNLQQRASPGASSSVSAASSASSGLGTNDIIAIGTGAVKPQPVDLAQHARQQQPVSSVQAPVQPAQRASLLPPRLSCPPASSQQQLAASRISLGSAPVSSNPVTNKPTLGAPQLQSGVKRPQSTLTPGQPTTHELMNKIVRMQEQQLRMQSQLIGIERKRIENETRQTEMLGQLIGMLAASNAILPNSLSNSDGSANQLDNEDPDEAMLDEASVRHTADDEDAI